MEGEQAPVQVGQFILAKNLGIGAFGKVGRLSLDTGSKIRVELGAVTLLQWQKQWRNSSP